MSSCLKLTCPSSRRLILAWDPRIAFPAASREIPAARRRRRNCAPNRIRSTVGPLLVEVAICLSGELSAAAAAAAFTGSPERGREKHTILMTPMSEP